MLTIKDGGWTKIRHSSGREGVVPTAYLDELPSHNSLTSPIRRERPPSVYSNSSASLTSMGATTGTIKKRGPAVAPRRGAKKLKHAEALYPYTAQSEVEFDMVEGERFVLISMGTGDGWAEVEKDGVKGSVPANYIQEVS